MIPTHHVPKCEMINRINILKHTANHIGVAFSLPTNYTLEDVEVVARELSSKIGVIS